MALFNKKNNNKEVIFLNTSFNKSTKNGDKSEAPIYDEFDVMRKLKHNNRSFKNHNPEFSASNIDLTKSHLNKTYVSHPSFRCFFNDQIPSYNQYRENQIAGGVRASRIFKDAYEHATNQKNPIAHELIFQLGNDDVWSRFKFKKDDPQWVATWDAYFQELIDWINNHPIMQGFKIFHAKSHMDETSPHLHVIGVSVKKGDERNKYGLEERWSSNGVFGLANLKQFHKDLRKFNQTQEARFNQLIESKGYRGFDLQAQQINQDERLDVRDRGLARAVKRTLNDKKIDRKERNDWLEVIKLLNEKLQLGLPGLDQKIANENFEYSKLKGQLKMAHTRVEELTTENLTMGADINRKAQELAKSKIDDIKNETEFEINRRLDLKMHNERVNHRAQLAAANDRANDAEQRLRNATDNNFLKKMHSIIEELENQSLNYDSGVMRELLTWLQDTPNYQKAVVKSQPQKNVDLKNRSY